jgi:sigma-B regulation protein RsbU (phosphoserine phosphatase)
MTLEIENLKESNEFLNLLLDNMDTAVLIADETLKIHEFNDSFLSLFDHSFDNVTDIPFGLASGCVNAVKENKICGETSACGHCVLRRSLLKTFLNDVPTHRKRLDRIFYIDGAPIQKYLEFTARSINFQSHKMILVIIYDITEIVQSKIELQQKQAQIDLDLDAAGQIQKGLLPHNIPEIPSIKMSWRFEPCQQVGGDIFHLYEEDQSQVSAYMLDVCGHGVSAALIAVTVKQFLDNLHGQAMRRGRPFQPAAILNKLEQEFPFDRFDCYFTIVTTLLNFGDGEFTYGCAGHVPPLIMGTNNKLQALNHHGPVIGFGQEHPFSQAKIQLQPGERIILYTDGLIDNFGPRGDYNGKKNFYNSLRRLSRQPVDQLVNGVMAESKKLRAGAIPDDDMSLFLIEYTS